MTIKPCLHCGGKGKLHEVFDVLWGQSFVVRCEKCSEYNYFFTNDRAAIAMWNGEEW